MVELRLSDFNKLPVRYMGSLSFDFLKDWAKKNGLRADYVGYGNILGAFKENILNGIYLDEFPGELSIFRDGKKEREQAKNDMGAGMDQGIKEREKIPEMTGPKRKSVGDSLGL